jgi:small subunit ribosomal protein S8
MTDPIADLLTRIRNGYGAKLTTVLVPHSIQKQKIVEVLVEQGYLESYESFEDENKHKQLRLTLKYVGKHPALTTIQRISTPGRRVYSPASGIKSVLSGHGIRIISTNKGIMIDKEAKKNNLGGEVICKAW